MIISNITLYHLRMRLKSPFETSFGTSHDRDCIILEAHSGDFVGYGECVADADPGYSYETAVTAWYILQDFLIPQVIDTDLNSAQDLQSRISSVKGHPMAKAGLEMVYWDLIGKSNGKSLQELVGGQVDRVKVGVSVGLQKDPDALVNAVADYLAQGYRRVKIKIKPGRDVSEVKAVRGVYPELALQVDANSAYTLESARVLSSLDEMDLLMIEQPLAEDDLWDHRQLQAEFRTPICLDESILSPRHARQALEMDACRVINIKSGRVGGLSQAVAIHDLCLAKGIPVWCGGMLETGIGRAANLALASLPGFVFPGDISATDRYYDEDITTERFELNPDSTINVPKSPGLGISIDKQALKRATVNKVVID
ncbi:MAG: o-succinylbenzoate synthase [Anaerolineales bacterium]